MCRNTQSDQVAVKREAPASGRRRPAVLLACTLAILFLLAGGCAGTGTMYNPENDVDGDELEYEAGSTDPAGAPASEAHSGGSPVHDSQDEADGGKDSSRQSHEDGREISPAYLEGTGSDLFSLATIDYYYKFTLEGVSLELPCSAAAFSDAGWEILVPKLKTSAQTAKPGGTADDGDDPHARNSSGISGEKASHPEETSGNIPSTARSFVDGGAGIPASGQDAVLDPPSGGVPVSANATKDAQDDPTGGSGAAAPSLHAPIPPGSFEFFDAVPAAESTGEEGDRNAADSSIRTWSSQRRIRVCLANQTTSSMDPLDCTLCGISASIDSDVSLATAFGTGFGDSLDDLFAVFGMDPSVYELTEFGDGVRMLRYTFSDGLVEGERIPVLPEAEEKNLSEQLLAKTGTDGETITELSLYYFRILPAQEIPGNDQDQDPASAEGRELTSPEGQEPFSQEGQSQAAGNDQGRTGEEIQDAAPEDGTASWDGRDSASEDALNPATEDDQDLFPPENENQIQEEFAEDSL